jgi:hypothetical protein
MASLRAWKNREVVRFEGAFPEVPDVSSSDLSRHPLRRIGGPGESYWNYATEDLRIAEKLHDLDRVPYDKQGMMRQAYAQMTQGNQIVGELRSGLARPRAIAALDSLAARSAGIGSRLMSVAARVSPVLLGVTLAVAAVAGIAYGIYKYFQPTQVLEEEVTQDQVVTLPGPGFLSYIDRTAPTSYAKNFFRRFVVQFQ